MLIKKFYSEFGTLDFEGAGLSTLQFLEVAEGQSTASVSELVKSSIKAIINFKQIAHDREY